MHQKRKNNADPETEGRLIRGCREQLGDEAESIKSIFIHPRQPIKTSYYLVSVKLKSIQSSKLYIPADP